MWREAERKAEVRQARRQQHNERNAEWKAFLKPTPAAIAARKAAQAEKVRQQKEDRAERARKRDNVRE